MKNSFITRLVKRFPYLGKIEVPHVLVVIAITFIFGVVTFFYFKTREYPNKTAQYITNEGTNVDVTADQINVSFPAITTNPDQANTVSPTAGQNSSGDNSGSQTTPTPGTGTSVPGPSPTPVAPVSPTPMPTATPAPPESPSAVVALYSDPQSDTDAEDTNHQRVVNYILNSGANPVFNAGDLMEDGTQASLNRFNAVTATLRSSRTFYSALGNNDRKEGDASTPSQLYLDNFSFPNNERWYSINYGNLHMVVLDSAFAAASQTQKNWLAADLQSAASQSRITGVIYHHPSFTSSISSYLINYNVDFVISGHNHAYQHFVSNGIHNFVATGQPNIGYFLIRIYSDRATVTVYNQNNGVVETVSFNER